MRNRDEALLLTLIIVAVIVALVLIVSPVHAEPAYPVVDVPMDDMTDGMKEALIRSVITEEEETKLAKMLWGEERQYDYRERAAVIWHVFNRVDSPLEANSVSKDLTHAHYSGYVKSNPVEPWAVWVVRDVAWRYACEREGYTEVVRVLPKEYCYMAMHRGHNRFRDKYKGKHDYDGKHYYDVLCSRCKMSYQIADYKFNNREIRYCVKCGAKNGGDT